MYCIVELEEFYPKIDGWADTALYFYSLALQFGERAKVQTINMRTRFPNKLSGSECYTHLNRIFNGFLICTVLTRETLYIQYRISFLGVRCLSLDRNVNQLIFGIWYFEPARVCNEMNKYLWFCEREHSFTRIKCVESDFRTEKNFKAAQHDKSNR